MTRMQFIHFLKKAFLKEKTESVGLPTKVLSKLTGINFPVLGGMVWQTLLLTVTELSRRVMTLIRGVSIFSALSRLRAWLTFR